MDLLLPVRSAFLLMHTMGSCDYPLTGDDGAATGVTVAVVEADLPGPPAQRGLNSPDYPGQLCSCPTLCIENHSSKKRVGVVRKYGTKCHCSFFIKKLQGSVSGAKSNKKLRLIFSPKHCKAITFPVMQLPLNENKLGN